MKVSYHWLCDFLDLKAENRSPDEVAIALARIGFALEGREEYGQDVVYDLEIHANRPDCLNHRGVARELAAHYGVALRLPDLTPPPGGDQANPASVAIQDSDLCPRYTARLIENVKVETSPDWLQKRLESLGQRPINNVVDITNYVMLHIGQPLHAFDFERLEGGSIVVRRSRPGERLKTLDGEDRELHQETLMICDARQPVAVAGVIGGLESEVDAGTSTVLLESAYFNPLQVRRTSKRMGVSTEASYRFERGSDPDLPPLGLHLASRMIEEIAVGSHCRGPVLDEYPEPIQRTAIHLTSERIRQLTGIDIEDGRVEGILDSLGFEVAGEGGDWEVVPPGFRGNVALEADLVEEVLRHYGYDQVEGTFPVSKGTGSFLPTRKKQRPLIELLVGQGFSEAINVAFTDPGRETGFWEEPTGMVEVDNPLTEEHTHLRKSLLPGLVESIRRNSYRGRTEVKLFELGKVFRVTSKGIAEETRLGLAATGLSHPLHWQSPGDDQAFSLFHLKGVVSSLTHGLGGTVRYRKAQRMFLEEGSAISVELDGREVGILGTLAADLQEPLRISRPLVAGELSLDPFYGKRLLDPSFREIQKYPSVESDLSFVVDTGVDFDRIAEVVQQLNIPELRGVHLIDLYRGPKLPVGKISLTVRLTFANLERTLTQDEANGFSQQVFAELSARCGIEARS